MSNNLLNEAYLRVKNCIEEEIREVEACSFTTDCWTSRQRFGYASLTLHFINRNFERVNQLIALKNISGSHTSEVLQGALVERIRHWHLEEKAESITTDNGK